MTNQIQNVDQLTVYSGVVCVPARLIDEAIAYTARMAQSSFEKAAVYRLKGDEMMAKIAFADHTKWYRLSGDLQDVA